MNDLFGEVPSRVIEHDYSKRARRSDPATSHAAAAKLGEFAHAHHAKILGTLMTQGPGTIYEIGKRIGIDHVAVARRMSELAAKRVVRPSGSQRRGPSGRMCSEWEAIK